MSETARRPPDEHEVAWRRNFWIILTLFGVSVLALLLLLVTLGFLWNSIHAVRKATYLARSVPPAATPAPAPLPVAVVPARPTRAAETIVLPGHPLAGMDWYVGAPASGRVARVLAGPGTRVAAGQAVARIATAVRRGPADRQVRRRTRAGSRLAGDTGAGWQAAAARPSRTPRGQWVTRPPSAAAVARREEAIRAARRRLARAESAVRGAESDLTDAREARARAQPARDVARQDVAEAEALVTRARAEVASQDAAVRQVEGLFRAGAASQSEVNESRGARVAAGDRLGRAQARAQAARSAAAAAEEGLTRAEAAVNTAEGRLRQAREEVASARAGVRSAENAPVPQAEAIPAPSVEPNGGRVAGSPGWSVVSTFADARAPAAGVVTTLLAGPGTYVSRGQALARVTRPGGQRYRVEGPAERLRGVRPGAPARVRGTNGASVPARVSAVFLLAPSPSGGGAGGRGPRRRVALEVVAAGAPLPVAPGSSIFVELTVLGPATAVAVPARAVRRTPAGPMVWVAERLGKEGTDTAWTARRLAVRVGARREGHVEIRAGLEPGSRVIVAGMEKLRDGQAVTVVPWSFP